MKVFVQPIKVAAPHNSSQTTRYWDAHLGQWVTTTQWSTPHR